MNPDLVYNVPDIRSFREMVAYSTEKYGERIAFTYFRKSGDIATVTYKETYADIRALTAYLNSKGYTGSHIGVCGKNCYEWALTYLTVTCGVGIIVPIDKELKVQDIAAIVDNSELELIICHDDIRENLDLLSNHVNRMPQIMLMSEIDSALAEGKKLIAQGDISYEKHRVDPDEMAVILYTSGTTGSQKGVMLSQHNICFDIVAMRKRFMIRPEDRVLSILPLHHTYECTAGFLTPYYTGTSIAYCTSLRQIMNDFATFRPTHIVAVPLLLENFHSNIVKKVKKTRLGSLQYNMGIGASQLSSAIGKVLFSQIHVAFGGRLKGIICGAAALSPVIFNDLTSFGFEVYNGYGLTETSPVVMMHYDFKRRYAEDVGTPLLDVQVKLMGTGDDSDKEVQPGEVGEIAVKGKNVMLGYYKDPEATSKVMADGWFYTGDLARQNERGDYQIMGRIKNVIVTKNGKKIFPEEMEALLEKNRFVKESVVYGCDSSGGDSVVTAKIYPDFEELNKYLRQNNPGLEDDIKAAENDEEFSEKYKTCLSQIFKSVIKEVNRGVPPYRYIHKFNIRKTEFVKTTTRKIKRNVEDSEVDYII
jgi:long-chain acyl-CoA synthetase